MIINKVLLAYILCNFFTLPTPCRPLSQLGPALLLIYLSHRSRQTKYYSVNVSISLSISFQIRCALSKETSHLDGSFEFPQYIFWLSNKILCWMFFSDYNLLTVGWFLSTVRLYHMTFGLL